jgi:hypothetical protein
MVDVTEIIFEHILSETVDEGLRIERIISTGKASLPRFLNTKARGFLRADLGGSAVSGCGGMKPPTVSNLLG